MGTAFARGVIAVEPIVHFQGERSIFEMIMARGVDRMDLHGALLGPNSVDHYLLGERMLDRMGRLLQTFEAHLDLVLPITTTTMPSDIAKETQVLDVTEDTEGDLEPF